MHHRWSRSVPTLGVAMLLSLALAQNLRHGTARASNQLSGPQCVNQLGQTGGESVFAVNTTFAVEQPLPTIGHVAACSLGMEPPSYAIASLDLIQWDPVTMAPDPTTVTLRTFAFNGSELMYNHARADYATPLVVRTIPRVAEPPRSTVAVRFSAQSFLRNLYVNYDETGSPDYGPANQLVLPSSRAPLPGAHPVLSIGVCSGDEAQQSLRVVQSVMRTDYVLDTTTYQIAQRFRVPVATTVRWVELAASAGPYRDPLELGRIAILEGQNMPTPSTQLPTPLVEATMSTTDFYSTYSGSRAWFTHFAFDHTIALLPEHDYWIVARGDHDYSFLMRNLTGTESVDFVSGVGPAYPRAVPNAPFAQVENKVLSFRVIGEPLLAVDAPTVVPRGSVLRLGASPNPSRGPVMLSWSGAKGRIEIEVLDARGRRVQRAEVDGPETGQWWFRGIGTDGRPLPAGLYFVRANDATDQRAIQRVALVR